MEDLHNFWGHRWVTEKCESKKSSFEGYGVFSIDNISKGELVAILGGIIVPLSDIKKYWDKMGQVGLQIHDNFFIVPTTRDELELKGVFNHSCEPNLGFLDGNQLIAIKDIKIGEELMLDYAFNGTVFESFECGCGASVCRKNITNEDWKNKEIQKNYIEYFSPYLKRRIFK